MKLEIREMPDGKKFKYIPLSKFSKKAGAASRQMPRYWIKKGEDKKGRKIRAFMLEGVIFISTYHLS